MTVEKHHVYWIVRLTMRFAYHMTYTIIFQLVLVAAYVYLSVDSFSVTPSLPTTATSSTSLSASKKTLTEETTWRLRFVLRGVATEKGKKVDEIFQVNAHFIEEEGYEPPQGSLQVISDDNDEAPPPRFQWTQSRWQLSEDPNDRKDGLWVWGLFKEPLYPFLLLQLQTDAIPVAGTEDDKIMPLQLYAQINHKRDEEEGVILEASDLKVRQTETIKADPFGAATVDLVEDVNIGTISVQPMTRSSKLASS